MAQVSPGLVHSASEEKTFKEALIDQTVVPSGAAFIPREANSSIKSNDGGVYCGFEAVQEEVRGSHD
ncbi:hypothetical protein SUGI_0107640 [Cryptomeria japonica]|nr:hypothetical protein SUGI_0107640 [Cryptomeria japonica]